MADKVQFDSPSIVRNAEPTPATRSTAAPEPRREPRLPFPVVVGCPRSGTSLVAVMLDSHPLLAIPPETSFIGLVASLYGGPDTVRERFMEIVTTDRITVSNWTDFGLDRAALHKRLQAVDPFSVAEGLRAFYALYAESERK